MKVFLTGGTGQVGYELKKRLEKLGHSVVAPSRKQLDLSATKTIAESVAEAHPDVIINAAAYTAVDKAEEDIEGAFAVNTHLPEALARFARARQLPLIHYSTDYVYSGLGTSPYKEDDQTDPKSVYGKSKLSGDKAIKNSGAQALILRTSWVYSARGHNFMKTMLMLASQREQLNVVDDQVGTPTSAAFIAETTIELLPLLVNNAAKGIYHLTPAGETSWYGFAQKIFELAREQGDELMLKRVAGIKTKDYPTPAQRPLNSRLSKEKLINLLQHELPTWQDELKSTLTEYYQQQKVDALPR